MSPEEVVARLIQVGLFDKAVDTALCFELPLDSIFEALASRCVCVCVCVCVCMKAHLLAGYCLTKVIHCSPIHSKLRCVHLTTNMMAFRYGQLQHCVTS